MANIIVNKKIKGDICILQPCGYVDENGGVALSKAVSEVLEEGLQKILIDFAQSPVINSQGIAQILELAEVVVDEKGGDLAYCGLSDLSLSVFKMVGLLQMGDLYGSEVEALDNMAS